MEFRDDLPGILIILGIIQGIFLSIFFLRRGDKNPGANKYLGIILILFAIHNLDFWLTYSRHILHVLFLFDISVPFTLAMGPLFYHYIFRSVNNHEERHLLLHYIPFVLIFLYSLFFIIQPGDFKYNVFVSSRNIDLPLRNLDLRYPFDPLGIRGWFGLIVSIQLTIYLVMSYIVLIKYLRSRSLSFARPGEPLLKWLRNLALAMTVIVVASVVIELIFPGGRKEYLLAWCFTVFIYFLSLNLIRGSGFLNQTLFPEKYLKSALTGPKKLEYKIMIEHQMTDQKLFLDKLFSVKRLSRATGIPPNQLSQILNESFNMSFFEFTKFYRIEEARRLLSDPANQEINIEEIATRVGYNSRSAFNRAFLNITGQTPLSFKKDNMH